MTGETTIKRGGVILAVMLFATLTVDAATCEPVPSGAVAWWRGENTARDSLGGHHATAVNGATHADGYAGRGFYFNAAANMAFQVPAPSALESPSAITVEAWVRPRSFPNGAPSVLRKNEDALGSPQFLLAVGDGSSPGLPHFNPGVAGASATGATELPLNAWTHLAGTYDGSTATLYVNGLVAATTAAAGTIPTSARDLFIGNEELLTDRAFDGYIDEVAVYDRALSATEIQAIHDAGNAGKCPPSAALPSGIVGAWRGEGDGKDAVGSNHGSLKNGAGFGTGIVGHAFDLDGGDDYVEIPDDPSLAVTSAITVEGWIRPDNVDSGGQILTQYDSSTDQIGWGFGVLAGGALRFTLSEGGAPEETYIYADTSSSPVSAGVWTHVAATFDAATDEIHIYANGVEVAAPQGAGSMSLASIFDSSAPVLIGALRDVTGNLAGHFPGLIDEVSLYNRALGASEIAAIHAAGDAGKGLSGGTTYVWFGGSGNWSDASNWTPRAIPGKNDAASIVGNYIYPDIDAHIGDLNFSVGNLWAEGGSLTLHGVCGWTGGRIVNRGTLFIAPGGELRLSGSQAKESDWRIENSGSIIYDGTGDWRIGSGEVIVNEGLLEVRNTRPFDWFGSGAHPLIENRGTLRKTSAGTTTMEPRFYNSGTVEIQDGVLNVNASGSFMDGGSFIGAGLTRLNTHTFTFSGTTGGSSLEVVSGLIEGSGTLSGGMTWLGGNMSGAHSLTIGPEATLTIDGTAIKTISSGFTLNNMGTVEFAGTGNIFSYYGGSIVNTGVFEMQNDQTFDYGNAGNRLLFDNQGTLRKVTATGTTVFEFQLNNSGTVDVRSGVLRLVGPGNFSDGGSFIGAGTTRLDTSTFTFTGATGGSSLLFASGLIAGSGTLTGGMEWTGGSMSGGHSLTVAAGATLTLSGAGARTLANSFTLNNEGALKFELTGDLDGSNATLNNSGLIDLAEDHVWDYPNSGNRNQVNNTGTIRKSAGGSRFSRGR